MHAWSGWVGTLHIDNQGRLISVHAQSSYPSGCHNWPLAALRAEHPQVSGKNFILAYEGQVHAPHAFLALLFPRKQTKRGVLK